MSGLREAGTSSEWLFSLGDQHLGCLAMDTKVFFVLVCLAAVCLAQGFSSRGSRRKTPTRIGKLQLTVSLPGARIYKGSELRSPRSGGEPEPVELGAFHWFDKRPGGGYAAISYNAGSDGYVSRFAYRSRAKSRPPGSPEPPLPLPPPSPPTPPTTVAPFFTPLIAPSADRRSGDYVPPSGVVQDTSFDDDIDERVSNALMAWLVGR